MGAKGPAPPAAINRHTNTSAAKAERQNMDQLVKDPVSLSITKERQLQAEEAARQAAEAGDRRRAEEDEARFQEAKNRPNIDWQEKIHRRILRGLRNISETP
jgi:hypothetical protein